MKPETMFYIALGTVIDDVDRSNAFREYASTEDSKEFRNKYNRLALKYKAKSIVEFDRTMDRLVKEYK
jgi:hypothetical protein